MICLHTLLHPWMLFLLHQLVAQDFTWPVIPCGLKSFRHFGQVYDPTVFFAKTSVTFRGPAPRASAISSILRLSELALYRWIISFMFRSVGRDQTCLFISSRHLSRSRVSLLQFLISKMTRSSISLASHLFLTPTLLGRLSLGKYENIIFFTRDGSPLSLSIRFT